ncbi:MAG TPA: hypothetical protein VIZ43_01420 [Trebonia sp.]
MLPELYADDALGVQFLGLRLHAGHGQLAGVVQGLGELLDLDVAAEVTEDRAHALVRDVVDAGAHDHAERGVAGPDERPEVLAGQVRGERLLLVVAPLGYPAAAGAWLGLDRGADRDELGDVRAELLHLDVQPHAHDAVGAERVRLGLHPGHRELARVVHRLGEDVQLLVLAPPAHLQPNVVDRRAKDQPERPEPGLADEQELVDRQV